MSSFQFMCNCSACVAFLLPLPTYRYHLDTSILHPTMWISSHARSGTCTPLLSTRPDSQTISPWATPSSRDEKVFLGSHTMIGRQTSETSRLESSSSTTAVTTFTSSSTINLSKLSSPIARMEITFSPSSELVKTPGLARCKYVGCEERVFAGLERHALCEEHEIELRRNVREALLVGN